VSVPPPVGDGTISLTGWSGYAAGKTGTQMHVSTAATASCEDMRRHAAVSEDSNAKAWIISVVDIACNIYRAR